MAWNQPMALGEGRSRREQEADWEIVENRRALTSDDSDGDQHVRWRPKLGRLLKLGWQDDGISLFKTMLYRERMSLSSL